jgi:hypothetical protein
MIHYLGFLIAITIFVGTISCSTNINNLLGVRLSGLQLIIHLIFTVIILIGTGYNAWCQLAIDLKNYTIRNTNKIHSSKDSNDG